MNNRLIILNPAAKSERAGDLRDRIQALDPAATLHLTRAPGDAQRLAAEAVANGFETIVAAGGDGTINEVVNGIGESGVTLGILPVGTMNVFAMELGIPCGGLHDAWAVIEAGHVRHIDLARANTEYFVQLGGVGLDAEVVRATPVDSKRALGPFSYVLSLLHLCGKEGPRLMVEAPGHPPIACRFVLIGNGRHYGGPLVLFKDASLDDGKLDAVVFKNQSPWDVIRYLQAIVFGNHVDLPDVEYLQAPAFRITGNGDVPVELDGELAGTLPCEFQVRPGALAVLVSNSPRTSTRTTGAHKVTE